MLTASEFEYVAQAGKTSRYYWGDVVDPSYVFYSENNWEPGDDDFHAKDSARCPVASLDQRFPGYCASPWGIMHIVGNVWQWAEDSSSGVRPVDGNERARPDSAYAPRLLFGGSVITVPAGFNSSVFSYFLPERADWSVGFRVVRLPKNH